MEKLCNFRFFPNKKFLTYGRKVKKLRKICVEHQNVWAVGYFTHRFSQSSCQRFTSAVNFEVMEKS